MKMTVNDTYAMILGLVLLVVGILGFVMPSPLLGLFGVNALQSVLHIIAGAAIYFGYKGMGRGANQVIGVIAAIVGVLYFVVPQLLMDLLAINAEVSYLHLVIAVVSLGLAYGVKDM
jgi:hypothetical protein